MAKQYGMPDLTHDQKITVLLSYGFTIGARDPARNAAYPGAFMVLESQDDEEAWCIVGDDIVPMVDEAFDLASCFDHFEAVCQDVIAGGDGILHINGTGAGQSH